ncbi:sugar phosphate nucleotidyltransferase [Bacteroidota bacterium]
MQAVILAGGLGTRLRPLTEQIPKVMLPFNGQPFLLYLLKLLKESGISDIVLCIGYLGEQVQDFFGGGETLGMSIGYSQERGELLGTGGALKQAQNLLDERFFVINGDTYLPIDYGDVEDTFLRFDRQALMVAYDNHEDTGVRNNVALDEDLMVTGYDKESPTPDFKYVEAGVLALRREALELLEPGQLASLEKGLYPALIRQRELAVYVTTQRFYDIGLPSQQGIIQKLLERRWA